MTISVEFGILSYKTPGLVDVCRATPEEKNCCLQHPRSCASHQARAVLLSPSLVHSTWSQVRFAAVFSELCWKGSAASFNPDIVPLAAMCAKVFMVVTKF